MPDFDRLDSTPLSQLRAEIDTIDNQILNCLKQRSESVAKIASIKQLHGMPIYDANREATILRKIVDANATLYDNHDLATIFQNILRASCNQQIIFRAKREK